MLYLWRLHQFTAPPPPPVHNGPFLHIAASTRLVSLDDGRSNRCGVRLHWGPGLHLPDC